MKIRVGLAMRMIAVTVFAVLLALAGTQIPGWLGQDEAGQSADCRANNTCP